MRVFRAAAFLATGLCMALTVVPAAGARRAIGLDTPLREAVPAYTSAQAEAALREVLPLVEDVTGRKIAHIPPIRLVTRQQAIAVSARNASPYQRPSLRIVKRAPGLVTSPPRPTRVTARRTGSQIYMDYAFGMYVPERRAIYLLPGNFRPRLDRAGVPRKYDQAILKMIVAHELTHALQQEVADETERDKGDKGSPEAARATIEGHATFVMDRVAQKIGMPQAAAEFHKTISVGLVLYADSDHQKANADFRALERRIFLDGEEFIAWHYQRGGNEQVYEILRHPPTKWSMIERPETYPTGSTTPSGSASVAPLRSAAEVARQ